VCVCVCVCVSSVTKKKLSGICYYLTSKGALLAKLQEHQGPQHSQNVGPDLFSVVQKHFRG